jgi:hypothetical protein
MNDLIPGQRIIDAIDKLDAKFEEFRRDVTSWQQERGETVVKLETIVKPALVNNGQKSRLSQVEDRISVLEHAYFKVVGASSVSGAVVALLIEIARKHYHF